MLAQELGLEYKWTNWAKGYASWILTQFNIHGSVTESPSNPGCYVVEINEPHTRMEIIIDAEATAFSLWGAFNFWADGQYWYGAYTNCETKAELIANIKTLGRYRTLARECKHDLIYGKSTPTLTLPYPKYTFYNRVDDSKIDDDKFLFGIDLFHDEFSIPVLKTYLSGLDKAKLKYMDHVYAVREDDPEGKHSRCPVIVLDLDGVGAYGEAARWAILEYADCCRYQDIHLADALQALRLVVLKKIEEREKKRKTNNNE